MDKDLQIVGFRIGKGMYGVPIASVYEIGRVPIITSVPDAPAYIEGVINLRGKIVSIVDLRKRFHEANIENNPRNRILVIEHSNKLVGLIVDSASEVLKISPSAIEKPPALLQDSGLNCISGVAKVSGRLVVLLDVAKLLPESQGRDQQITSAELGVPDAQAALLPVTTERPT